MKPAQLLVPLALLASLAWTACSTSPSSPGKTSPAGQGGTDGGAGPTSDAERFGDSSCRACQAEACASQESDCKSEPACAGYLDCLDACPTTSEGALDATCASACPRTSAVELLAGAVDACREQGSGLECACGASGQLPDILNQDCPASTDENACYKCEDERCCETYASCHANDECTAFMACAKTCEARPFAQCIVDCGQQHPEGLDQGLERLSCLFMRCPEQEECGNMPLDPCVKCGDQRCTEEVLACSLSYACQRINACDFDCTTAKCHADCYASDAQGALEFTSYIGCVTEQCASECG